MTSPNFGGSARGHRPYVEFSYDEWGRNVAGVSSGLRYPSPIGLNVGPIVVTAASVLLLCSIGYLAQRRDPQAPRRWSLIGLIATCILAGAFAVEVAYLINPLPSVIDDNTLDSVPRQAGVAPIWTLAAIILAIAGCVSARLAKPHETASAPAATNN